MDKAVIPSTSREFVEKTGNIMIVPQKVVDEEQISI